jgi:hypothetical protein
MPGIENLDRQTQTPPVQAKSFPSGQQAAREMLLLCATADISTSSKERISQILVGSLDWTYFLNLAKFHGTTLLITHALVTNGLSSHVPQPYLEQLNQIYNSNLYRNVILSNELKKLLAAFSQHGIKAIVLKGTILAYQLYGNPGLRTVTDMDILIPLEKVTQASSLIMEMGYRQSFSSQAWDHPFHELPYCKMAQFPFMIELHWDLDDQRIVTAPSQEIWRRAKLLDTPEGTVMVLSPEDILLFLSNHLSKHSSQLLRSLIDIAELLKKYNGTLDWDYILKSAHKWGVKTAVYCALKRSKELLLAPVPASVIRALRPKACRRWLLDFLVSQEFFVGTTRLTKLQDETYTIVRSLMMQHGYQTALVLARNRGKGRRIAWLKIIMWFILVFGAALARNIADIALPHNKPVAIGYIP